IYTQLGSRSSVSENFGGYVDNVGNFNGFLPPVTFDIDFIAQAPIGVPSVDQQGNYYGYPQFMPLIRVLDYDQDGRDELLFLSRSPGNTGPVYVEKWNGTGMTEIIPDIAAGINRLEGQDSTSVFEVLNYSGSGLGDVLRHEDTGLVLF